MNWKILLNFNTLINLFRFLFFVIFFSCCNEIDTGFNSGNNREKEENTYKDESGLPPCNSFDPICHYYADKFWSGMAEKKMTWTEAKLYCTKLGGRLPTISELRTLVIICEEIQPGGKCGVTDECLQESCLSDDCSCETNFNDCSAFNDEKELWSISEVTDTDFVWFLDFDLGDILFTDKEDTLLVRCTK